MSNTLKLPTPRRIGPATLITAALSFAPGLSADSTQLCNGGDVAPVWGKIENNFQPTGNFSTLGVVRLRGQLGKMKCGIVGEAAPSNIPPEQGGLGFVHTISCDDDIWVNTSTGHQKIHSQLTFDTQGQIDAQLCDPTDPNKGVHGEFIEYSVPKTMFGQSSGRGVFAGVTEGLLVIKGELTCLGTIDMRFKGYVCK